MTTRQHQYPQFIFEDLDFGRDGQNFVVHFHYQTPPDHTFTSTLTFHDVPPTSPILDTASIAAAFLFPLGMVEALSYWKATCSPQILVKPYALDSMQLAFWRQLTLSGMGEYFYKNSIDFREKDFLTITSLGSTVLSPVPLTLAHKYLVPIGGGKDSAVTLKLLSEVSKAGGFLLRPGHAPAAEAVIRANNTSNLHVVDRTIDPKLLALNAEGYYNGHTPYSAYLAFLSLFVAAIYGYDSVAVSNEQSSNEETTSYLGMSINHQFSKTVVFEKMFREYAQSYITKEVTYFSALRPLYEIQIAKLFSAMDIYFPHIRSCNKGRNTNSWCCQCPKCLSTYILLFPFLGPEKILEVFPDDLYQHEALYTILQDLVDPSHVRPFECVGTREESLVGLFLSIKKYGEGTLPVLLSRSLRDFSLNSPEMEKRAEMVLQNWNAEHFLPEKVANLLKGKL